MKTKLWTTVFVVGLLILLTHFVWVTPALADDVTPPPVPTEEVVVETLPPTEEPVAEVLPIEPVATEEPVVVEPIATEPPTTEEPVPVDLLQDLPADTSLVVLGENGEVLPLATQEAAEVMAVADPMWCPAGATTVTVDCVNDTTIGTIGSGNLLDKIIAKVTTLDPIHGVNGVIYFTPTYSVNDVLFDGSLPAINFEGNALTLQGGWDGNTTQNSTITLSGSSTFSVPISITNWGGDVKISDVTVNKASGVGITVGATGDVILNSVISNENTGAGLYIVSDGDININNLTADKNSKTLLEKCNTTGAFIKSTTGTIAMTGNNSFSDSVVKTKEVWGLVAVSAKDMNLSNLTINSNGDGALLYPGNFTLKGTLHLTGTNQFNWNGSGYGITVHGGNAIISNVTATGNTYGLYLRPGGQLVLDNINVYQNLDGILSYDSMGVYMKDMTAVQNRRYGVHIFTAGGVTVEGANVFSNNASAGLEIYTSGLNNSGKIVIDNTIAESNGSGVVINNINTLGGAVSLSNSIFLNNKSSGLRVYTYGDITLNNISANSNKGDGAYLFTSGSASVTGTEFKNNSGYGIDGNSICIEFSYSGVSFLNNTSGDANSPVSGMHSYKDANGTTRTIYCEPRVYVDGVLMYGSSPAASLLQTISQMNGNILEFALDCSTQSQYDVNLPNQDRVKITCPVTGKAIIKRLNNTAIPGELPAGYTYASAFSLDILQSGKSISYISEGGRVNVSFDVPNLQEGTAYTLLYWDNGNWLPLKDFMLDENGNPREFNLHPNDPRMILSGLKLVFEDGTPRLELSTNFPGIFVLVQR